MDDLSHFQPDVRFTVSNSLISKYGIYVYILLRFELHSQHFPITNTDEPNSKHLGQVLQQDLF